MTKTLNLNARASAALRKHIHSPSQFSPSATLDALFRVFPSRWQQNDTDKCQNLLLPLFNSTKAQERTKETKTNSILSNTRALKSSRVPPTTGGKCASDENDYSSERNSTERLKGRCFVPCGISSYSLSQSADRSFIEISAHRTCFNNSCILLKRIQELK